MIASFGRMIPDNIIDTFPHKMLVMHPSLLPKYRGSCPIQHAILNRDSETGISVIEISKGKFDAGDILVRESGTMITDDTRFGDLSLQLANQGGNALYQVLDKGIDSLKSFQSTKIDQKTLGKATKAPIIKASFGEIKFSELASIDV